MDHSRTQPTYLDYRSSLRKVGDPRSPAPRRTSATPPLTASTTSGSVYRTGSRTSSISAFTSISTAAAAAAPVPPKPSPSPTPSSSSYAPPPATGQRSLLVVVSSAESNALRDLLERVLTRYTFDAVTVIGPDAQLVKQTKMDLYTVAGRMSRNLAVYTGIVDLTNLEDTKQGLNKYAQSVAGVLCCLGASATGLGISETDILDTDTQALETALRSSTVTIHAIARHTLPLMSRQHISEDLSSSFLPHDPHIHQHSFFLLDSKSTSINSSLYSVPSTAQETLIKALARSPAAQGVDIGYAQDIVPPLPEKHPERSQPERIASVSNGTNGAMTPGATSPVLSESPTKLWSLWASYAE